MMELTQEQYQEIKPSLPGQRGKVKLSNRKVRNRILSVAEHGCKWRGLPSRFGNWPTIYRRMNRGAKTGVLNGRFEAWPAKKIIPGRIAGYSLDGRSVKVHPDGTGALKKWPAVDWKVRRRVDHKNPSAGPRCW
jgi:transposase